MGALQHFHRKLPGFRNDLSIARHPVIPPPESSPWYWNPNCIYTTMGPAEFRTDLKGMDPTLEVTWDRYHENWLIWMKKEKFQSKLCRGWVLLFPVRYADGSYMPLDNRVFARLYTASADRWGSGRGYFHQVQNEMERDRERAQAASMDETRYKAGEYFDYMAIKNIGSGSKFANHFSG